MPPSALVPTGVRAHLVPDAVPRCRPWSMRERRAENLPEERGPKIETEQALEDIEADRREVEVLAEQ